MPIKDISADLAGLVGMWCTSVLYGVNIVMYFTCVYVLLKRKSKGLGGVWVLLGSTTLQFILSTVYVAVALRMAIESFIWLTAAPGAAAAYWADPSKPILAVSKGVYITNTLIGDTILVWRLYVVWGGKYYIHVFPAVMLVGTAVSGYISVAHLAHLTSVDALFLVAKTLLVTWSLTIATQVSASALIAGRIWWISRQPASATHLAHRSRPIIWMIIESGAIYTISTIILLILFDLKTQAGSIIADITLQIGAIIPTAIIVRVGLGLDREPSAIKYQFSSNFPLKPRGMGPAIIQISNTTRKDGESQISNSSVKNDIELQ
ncbi:hypothetical protein BD779DRAFT_1784783 [Infundibulicybe gibba]|nr:hypothetical protein BD779DRAFT_1784783 [Infundibulicybe gibba]